MGTYATTTSLQITMIGLSFDTATTSLVSKCITWAENEVNKYIGRRYDISVFSTYAATPPLITTLTEQLAEGYTWQRTSRGGKESMARGKEIIDKVIENLKLITKYKLDLVNSSGSIISERSSNRIRSTTEDYVETFAEDDPLSWEVDDTKIDEIEDDRG